MQTIFYTIGVYGLSPELFFEKLVQNGIDTFVDIRRRRAVRGSLYAFVNSKRLQNRLHELGINYVHILDLAPTNEIRNLQKEADLKSGVAKRERSELGGVFIKEYHDKILERFDINIILNVLEKFQSKKAALFCVEKEPKACHRSLVAAKLKDKYSASIIDL